MVKALVPVVSPESCAIASFIAQLDISGLPAVVAIPDSCDQIIMSDTLLLSLSNRDITNFTEGKTFMAICKTLMLCFHYEWGCK